MKKILLSFLLPVIILSGVFTGCSKKSEDTKNMKTIAVVTPYMANATTAYAVNKFSELAKAKGYKVIVSDSAGDFNMLVSRIDDAVNSKADAIVLGMGDPEQMVKGLENAKKANIPVFGIDAGVNDYVLINVTSDNMSLGEMSANALVKSIGGKGNVILFTHDPHPGVKERADGARKVFKSNPDIKIINESHINVPGPLENARKIMSDFLVANSKEGDIAGVWAGWDEPAMGATQAVEAANKAGKIKIVGIDGTDFAQDAIKNGDTFVSTIAQDFDAMAEKCVALITDYFNGSTVEHTVVKIPGKEITKK